MLGKEILTSKTDDKKLETSGFTNIINVEDNISRRPAIMSNMSVTNVRGIAFVGMQVQG